MASITLLQSSTDCVVVPGGVGVAPQRPVSKGPTVLPIAPQTSLSNRSSTSSVMSSKGTAAVAPCVSKPHQQQLQPQQLTQNSTSVLSQLGMKLSALCKVNLMLAKKRWPFKIMHSPCSRAWMCPHADCDFL